MAVVLPPRTHENTLMAARPSYAPTDAGNPMRLCSLCTSSRRGMMRAEDGRCVSVANYSGDFNVFN
jgi:hypothetical protein